MNGLAQFSHRVISKVVLLISLVVLPGILPSVGRECARGCGRLGHWRLVADLRAADAGRCVARDTAI